VSARTFADQLPAVDALAQITATMGHLPPADFGLSPITPDRLDISIHDNLDGFEQWRTALGIAAADVDHCQRPGRSHMTLRGRTTFAGATVELIGYAPALPQNGGEQA
jgi:hypothetical protein